jgi:hypothetical protein
VITLNDMVEQLKASGAAVGMDDVVRAAGYGVGGVSGYASAGAKALAQANTLARELYEEAVAKFGRTVVTSKKTAHLSQMERFLKSHAKYKQLMQYLKELPRNLLPKGKLVPAANSQATRAVARNFRRAFILPYNKWNSARYLSSAARQLNGKLGFFKALGRHATWYIPATLGLINVADAPQGMKVRTMFEEGFSIVGGCWGTAIGQWAGAAYVVPAAAKLMTFCGLCLGPWGMVVIVAICAIATGWAMMELLKSTGKSLYIFPFRPVIQNRHYIRA